MSLRSRNEPLCATTCAGAGITSARGAGEPATGPPAARRRAEADEGCEQPGAGGAAPP